MTPEPARGKVFSGFFLSYFCAVILPVRLKPFASKEFRENCLECRRDVGLRGIYNSF